MSARKKIAIVNVFFPPQAIGGATRVVADNVDVLQARYADRYELVAYTSDADGDPAHHMHTYAWNGLRVYRAGVVQRANMDWHPFDPEQGELFGRFLDFERPDLVHFHCVQRLSASLLEAALARNVPYLVTVHDAWWISDHQFLVDQDGVVYPEGHPDPYAPLTVPSGITLDESLERRAQLKALLGQARQVLAVSETFASLYRRNGIANAVATPNGIHPRAWPARQPSPNGRVRIGHIGGMSPHKGYELLRDAVTKGGFRNLEILVVDHGKAHGYHRNAQWGSTPVTCVGKVPQDRVGELFAQMDVLAAPSTWPESFGLVTREAAAAGVWVLTSDIGAIGEDVEDGVNGWRVKAGSLDSLATALRGIDSSPSRYLASPPSVRQARTVEQQVEQLTGYYNSCSGQ